MAPISSKKRTTARAKSARTSRPRITLPAQDDALFPSSKKDKRTIRHSAFVSKIEKSHSKTQKRRRPNKKLVANLEALADALPGLENGDGKDEVVVGQAKIQRKSLNKSRPGAMKRLEELEKMERERFNMNLAQMATGSGTSGRSANGSSISDRWAALKSHVQSTTEIKPEFTKK
ncbi:hypothetical protein BU26DRAFT_460517 [Trematosphaeria pertusa]|uniref:Ribosome biogenesis protein SLX9 n=1 Tax=Trematosphaeria pertusa TaxID=390896 RepID=A0A6A6I7S9_9PLEO|nr:uncharacterized protein BU26DRAFT_460517 [Trematosphaeria pertusa]KAF2246614.1 hypothetical protein BU26DRAFT_460517 [Trematosphaeria pertusa]